MQFAFIRTVNGGFLSNGTRGDVISAPHVYTSEPVVDAADEAAYLAQTGIARHIAAVDRKGLLRALDASYAATCAAGVTVQGVQWKATDSALNSFTALAALLREKEAALTTDESRAALHGSQVTLMDLNDAPHSMTVVGFRAFVTAYGDAVLALWHSYTEQRAALA